MSSNIIKADNGASSGVTGIVQTAGSDGTLLLQTTSAGGTATTALTIDNSQNTTLAGNLTFASGKGLTFNNSSALTNSQLNDYETGTWTPTCSNSGLTSYTSSGYYTKIGNIVNVAGLIYITNAGTASGSMNITGLPFTTSTGSVYLQVSGVTRETGLTGVFYFNYIGNNSTTMNIFSQASSGVVWGANYVYSFTVTYKTTF
jgi:hypothetical protein